MAASDAGWPGFGVPARDERFIGISTLTRDHVTYSGQSPNGPLQILQCAPADVNTRVYSVDILPAPLRRREIAFELNVILSCHVDIDHFSEMRLIGDMQRFLKRDKCPNMHLRP